MIAGLETSGISFLGGVSYIRSPLLPSLIDPLRYADTLLQATKKAHMEHGISAPESREGVIGAITCVLKQVARPVDVKDVVCGLFMSDVRCNAKHLCIYTSSGVSQ